MSETFEEYNARRVRDYQNMMATGPVVDRLGMTRHLGRNIHTLRLLNYVACNLTDTQLIDLADHGVGHFGGRVERHLDRLVTVHVYID